MKLRMRLFFIIISVVVVSFIFQVFQFLKISSYNDAAAWKYLDSTMKGIDGQLRDFSANIENASFSFGFSRELSDLILRLQPLQREACIEVLKNTSRNICRFNRDIIDVMLVEMDGTTTSFYSGFDREFIKIFEDRYDFYNPQFAEAAYIYLPGSSEYGRKFFVYAFPVFSYYSADRNKISTGVIVMRFDYIRNLISHKTDPENYDICAVDTNHIIIASSGDRRLAGAMAASTGNRRSLQIVHPVPQMNLTLTGEIRHNIYSKDAQYYFGVSLLIAVFMTLLIIAEGLIFQHTVTRPIHALVSEISRIGQKGPNDRISGKYPGEIRTIADSLNTMLENLKSINKQIFEMQDKLYESEINRNLSELHALQAQINPHFLYNTLQCIRSLALEKDCMDIAAIVSAMSNMFHYSIKEKEFVTIRQEMDMIQQYFFIIDIRFKGRIFHSVHIRDDILDCKIPKMILQPIVENAIKHGAENLLHNGEITIEGFREKNKIHLKVTDNGPGFDQRRLEDVKNLLVKNYIPSAQRDRVGLGLYNINRRIKQFFGEEYGVSIEALSAGTCVHITFYYNESY